jgi:hypothetical protein
VARFDATRLTAAVTACRRVVPIFTLLIADDLSVSASRGHAARTRRRALPTDFDKTEVGATVITLSVAVVALFSCAQVSVTAHGQQHALFTWDGTSITILHLTLRRTAIVVFLARVITSLRRLNHSVSADSFIGRSSA